MASDFPDALKQYKKFKSMGGAFVLARNGSAWDLQIHPKVMIPRIKAIAMQAKGQIIAGEWTFEGGTTKLEITYKKGKLTLNDDVRRRVKNGLELGTQPEIAEASDLVEEGDSHDDDDTTTERSSPKVTGVDDDDFGSLDALNAFMGGQKQEVTDPEEQADVSKDLPDDVDLGGLDFLADIDLESSVGFSGSVKDIAMARLAWGQAEKGAEKLLKALADAILSDFPTETDTAKGVTEAIERVQGGDLMDALDDLSNAKGNEDAAAMKAAHTKSLAELDSYESFVDSDPVLAHIDSSPYQVGSVRDQLTIGIKAIRKNLT